MKIFTTTTEGYTYSELSDTAKEAVKQWYLNDYSRQEFFNEDIEIYLSENFPHSDLSFIYSLCYCQGDGFNIEGRFNLIDFLDKWEASDKERRTLKFFIPYFDLYNFKRNNHYNYSCKFIDKKYIDDEAQYQIDYCSRYFANVDKKSDLIKRFYNDFIDFFDELDEQFKKRGYYYFYNVDDEEINDYCEANEFYFTVEGEWIK